MKENVSLSKKLSASIIIVVIFIAGIAYGSGIFSVSNTINDRISVEPNNIRNSLHIQYEKGNELGGPKKKIQAGKWENFGLEIINESPEEAPAWENIFIRMEIVGINREKASLLFKKDGEWKSVRTKDIRTLNKRRKGFFVDIGPKKGWRIPSGALKNIKVKIKFYQGVENLDIRITSISKNVELERYDKKINSTGSSVLEPDKTTFIYENEKRKNFSDRDYLELRTQREGNSYVLLDWKDENFPPNIKEAYLLMHKYWGHKYSKLRNENIKLQINPIIEGWKENTTTWKNKPNHSNLLLDEINLHKEDWYKINLENYFENQQRENYKGIVIKFSETGYDSEKRRIRFDTVDSKLSPYLLIEE
ncbi:MAG: DNRLRE domain-containing protein [Candidatus Hadarchaeota archaeon]